MKKELGALVWGLGGLVFHFGRALVALQLHFRKALVALVFHFGHLEGGGELVGVEGAAQAVAVQLSEKGAVVARVGGALWPHENRAAQGACEVSRHNKRRAGSKIKFRRQKKHKNDQMCAKTATYTPPPPND